MPLGSFSLHSLCFSVVVDHLVVPVFIEVTYFFNMGHLHLSLFFLKTTKKFLLAVLFQLFLYLNQSSLGSLGFHVLTTLLTSLLMRIQHLSASMMELHVLFEVSFLEFG